MNKVLHGNCNELINTIENNSIDLIFIDPPYGKIINKDWDKTNGINIKLLNEYYRVLKPTGSIYICCGIGEKSNSLLENLNMISNTKFIFKDLITWKKQKGYGAKKGWLYTREEIIWLVKDNNKFFWNENNQYNLNEKRNYKRKIGKSWYKRFTNVWDDISENLYSSIHSDRLDGDWYANFHNKYPTAHETIKPVELIERIINVHTEPNNNYLVLDTFAGTSTTAIACIKNNVNFIMMEKELEYIDISNERINNFINKEIKENINFQW